MNRLSKMILKAARKGDWKEYARLVDLEEKSSKHRASPPTKEVKPG